MTITYRGVKDEALTYNELDENFRDLRLDTDLERVLINGNVANLTIVVPQVITDVSFVGGSNVTEAFIATNNYTLQVGAASNAWTNTQISETGSAANAWTNAQISITGAAANAWTNAQIAATGAAANAYALSISTTSGTSSNNYTIEVGAASNTYANTIGITIGAGANIYSDSVGAAANNWSNTKISNTSVTVAGGLKMTDVHLLSNVTIPLSATTGNVGQISWDGDYLYVCVATNQWKRTQILSW